MKALENLSKLLRKSSETTPLQFQNRILHFINIYIKSEVTCSGQLEVSSMGKSLSFPTHYPYYQVVSVNPHQSVYMPFGSFSLRDSTSPLIFWVAG